MIEDKRKRRRPNSVRLGRRLKAIEVGAAAERANCQPIFRVGRVRRSGHAPSGSAKVEPILRPESGRKLEVDSTRNGLEKK
jgi:hypothetical protein